MSTACLELDAATVAYGGETVVDALSLQLRRGEVLALVGPSGAGKSTVLRLMLGLIAPTAGTVRFDGKALGARALVSARRRMGYVIQEGGLFPHLTAEGNAALMGRYLGWSRSALRRRIHELAELVHLDPALLKRMPRELSGGQRQRVALMRALLLDPEVLLLDEPLGALDTLVRRSLQQELRELFAALDKSVVLVTHDLAEAGYLGDRIALIADGRVRQVGPLRALVEAPVDDFVARFVGAHRSLAEVLSA